MTVSRPDTHPLQAVWLSTLVAVFMIAQQIASKAVRDGFFLSHFEATALPAVTVASAVTSFCAALFLGKAMARFGPTATAPALFFINGSLFLVEAALANVTPRLVACVLYLHLAALGAAVVSGFWSVINEQFDPYAARKIMGRIAGGASFGGVLGGIVTWLLAEAPTRYLMTGFGVSSLLCAAGLFKVGLRLPRKKSKEQASAALLAGVSIVSKQPYPRAIALIVFAGALVTAAIDFLFKAGVSKETLNADLVGFFAAFYTATGITTFIVQALGSQRILHWLGVVPTVGLLPLTVLLFLPFALFSPSLASLVTLRGGTMVIENSLYRSGYELMYTAIPKAAKRSAKMLIDLGCDRLGTAAGSGLVLAVIALAPAHVSPTLLALAAATSLGVIGALTVVRKEYVASLANQIRTSLHRNETTGRAGVGSPRALARTLVGDIDLWTQDFASSGESSSSSSSIANRVELLAAIQASAEEKRRAQAKPKLPEKDDSLVPQVATGESADLLLASPLRERLRDTHSSHPKWQQLVRVAPSAVGLLGDIVVSTRESIEVRLRAAQLLATTPTQRAALALTDVLAQPHPRIRRAAALALLKLSEVAPQLRPSPALLDKLAVEELRKPAIHIAAHEPFELASPFRMDAHGNPVTSNVELIFLLLALKGQVEELRLALSAITSQDASQRGTSLEYLDNVVSSRTRSRLLALLEQPEKTQARLRVATDIVAQLATEFRQGKINLAELRKRYRRERQRQYEGSLVHPT